MLLRSLLALLFGLPLAALPEENVTGLRVELVSEVTHVQPGTPFYVGLFIQHEPGFHTYWKQPGIVGVPTSLKWDLPRGWKGGELDYPEPERVLMFTLKAQGYERDVLLQARVTPPPKLEAGTSITLAGRAVWMCCAQSCHPGFKDVSLTLPVASAPPALDRRWHPVFEKERAARAQPSSAWTAQARQLSDAQVELRLTPASPAARPLDARLAQSVLFFTGDGWIDSDDPHVIEYDAASRGLRLLLPVSKGFRDQKPPRHLDGLLQLSGGWEKSGRPHTITVLPPLER